MIVMMNLCKIMKELLKKVICRRMFWFCHFIHNLHQRNSTRYFQLRRKARDWLFCQQTWLRPRLLFQISGMLSTLEKPKKRFLTKTSNCQNSKFNGFQKLQPSKEQEELAEQGPATATEFIQPRCFLKWTTSVNQKFSKLLLIKPCCSLKVLGLKIYLGFHTLHSQI